MPGSTPATSQLDWLISITAMIVLFWSRATRDLLKSFGWGIAALHRLMQRAQHGIGIGRAHNAHMQLVREADIADEGAPPGEQRRVLQPSQRVAEKAVC